MVVSIILNVDMNKNYIALWRGKESKLMRSGKNTSKGSSNIINVNTKYWYDIHKVGKGEE